MKQERGNVRTEGFNTATHGQTTALWTAAFFDELVRCGVREAVVSPGSRSTPLAMAAFEFSQRNPGLLRMTVDVDERGAAFLGLGMAKATGRPVALICTSGTATANYYPAVIEAETSRVPLIALTGDRPPRLQGLGAPQTTDQLNLYGAHARAFRAMPLPGADGHALAFARQAAREAVLAATGGCPGWDMSPVVENGSDVAAHCQIASRACQHMAGPVQVNFPFDDPLKPDFAGADDLAAQAGAIDAFAVGGGEREGFLPPVRRTLDEGAVREIAARLAGKRALVLAGEGTCATLAEALRVAAWAREWNLPVLADPLSGLRAVDEPHIIDAYDAFIADEGCLLPQTIIRFGRWPISKRATTALAAAGAETIVVDAGETRDCNTMTSFFVAMTPLGFAEALIGCGLAQTAAFEAQRVFLSEWEAANERTRERLSAAVRDVAAQTGAAGTDGHSSRELHEATVFSTVLEHAPTGSCLFAANSMTVRNLDTFLRRGKRLCILANRGQNGIDGTLSSAIGAARAFHQATFVTGDLTLQHDINALALQRELLRGDPASAPTLVIVLLNNDGGAIFDMLPQASDQPYFERLFLTPQGIDFQYAAAAFGVPYRKAESAEELARSYEEQLGVPGISIVETRTPLREVKERLGGFWK